MHPHIFTGNRDLNWWSLGHITLQRYLHFLFFFLPELILLNWFLVKTLQVWQLVQNLLLVV